ncbi:MAG: DUF4244 domain-containing protein [Propionibacteriaceae bacterium]
MKALVKRTRNQRGMATAEYAAGTLAAVSFAGVLFKVITDPSILQLLLDLVKRVLSIIFKWGI